MKLTLLVCVLYAISDETHQIFVPGRSAQVSDILIDSVGAAVGILIYLGMRI
ncbi:MAG: VanZ family protein [Alkaliphilus sp.]